MHCTKKDCRSAENRFIFSCPVFAQGETHGLVSLLELMYDIVIYNVRASKAVANKCWERACDEPYMLGYTPQNDQYIVMIYMENGVEMCVK